MTKTNNSQNSEKGDLGKTPHRDIVTFIGTIPAIGRAVDFHGDGGCRLQVDIPDSEKPAALTLAAYFLRKKLKVTMQCLNQETK